MALDNGVNDSDIGDPLIPTDLTHQTYGVARSGVAARTSAINSHYADDIGEPLAPPSDLQPDTPDDHGYLNSAGRGLRVGVKQIAQTGYGLAALAGDTIGSDSLRDYGLKKYQEWSDDIAKDSRPSDSLWDVVSKDDPNLSLKDWAGYATGYLGAQLATGLGIGSIGKWAAGKVAMKAVENMAEKAVTKKVAAGMAADARS